MMKIDFNAQDTHFAQAARTDMQTVLQQNESLREASFLEEVFAKIPVMFLILNKERQIVYLNSLLATEFEQKQFSHTLGYRPGEMLNCENAFIEPGGCGTSEHCKFCGIVNTVLESDQKNDLVKKETLLSTDYLGIHDLLNYEVSSRPFDWASTRFFIVTLADISYRKRKEQLERTFFHDLLNKISSVSGIVDMVQNENPHDEMGLLDMLKRGVTDLANEIKFQRNLSLAEKGELLVTPSSINSLEIIKYIKEDFLPYETVWNKKIEILPDSESFNFNSDVLLVNRIFTNLIKNSLEAVESGQNITVRIQQRNNKVLFEVHNDIEMDESVKHSIFRKTFSTKGMGRGVGTYSVKLFTEVYLSGKTWFTSTAETGTTFFVELPLVDENSNYYKF
jgi:two-component sensor histidine kinase